MFKKRYLQPIITIIFSLLVIVFGMVNLTQASWVAPTGNPYTGEAYSFFNNTSGSDGLYVVQKAVGTDNYFTVGAAILFVSKGAGRVGVLTSNPQTELDVWGTVKSFNTNTLPTCNSDLLGAIIFNTNQNRLNVCVNNGWHRIGYDGDLDHWLDYADCNDNDATIYPGAPELCDGKDHNCNTIPDDGCVTCYRDADNDGFGNSSVTSVFAGCPGKGSYVTDKTDCNDSNSTIYPGAPELCDGLDHNCNTIPDDGCVTCYRDADGDGYGNPSITKKFLTCPGTGNYVSNNLDCDDANASKAIEICGDTISNDCDAQINEGCACTATDWSSPTCPDMSTCLTTQYVNGTKLSDCTGGVTQPVATCYCTCRLSLDHFISLTGPACPVCVSSYIVKYTAKQSGVTCTDSSNIWPRTACSANCAGTCSGDTCCKDSSYYYCSGSTRMYHSTCGVNSTIEYCTYGCTSGTCNSDPCAVPVTQSACLACGGSWTPAPPPGTGGWCVMVGP